MDDMGAGWNAGTTGTGTHFPVPSDLLESSLGNDYAPVHAEADTAGIDGRTDSAIDDGNQSDGSNSSKHSGHGQPYCVSRYEGINVTCTGNCTPRGVYRRNDSFQRTKSLGSSLTLARELSGNVGDETSESPLRKSNSVLGAPPAGASTLASAFQLFPLATPHVSTLSSGSTLVPPMAPPEHAPGGEHVSIQIQTEEDPEVPLERVRLGPWGKLVSAARFGKTPEQRIISFLSKNRAQNKPARSLVSYNRSPTRGNRGPALAADYEPFATIEESASEPTSAWAPMSAGIRSSPCLVPVQPSRAGGSVGQQDRPQMTSTPAHTPHEPGRGGLGIPSVVMVKYGDNGDTATRMAGAVMPKVAHDKPTASSQPLGKHASTFAKAGQSLASSVTGSLNVSTVAKGSRFFKGHKHGSVQMVRRSDELADGEDGLIFGYRLDGNGGAKKITKLADWKRSTGTPENPVWIHLNGTSAGAQRWLAEKSGLEKLVVEALVADDARPRSSTFSFGTLFVIRAVNAGSDDLPEDMVSVRLFLQPELLVTVRHRKLAAEEDAVEPLNRGRGPRTAAGVVVLLIEKCTLRMGPVVGAMEDVLDSIEKVWVVKGNSEALSNQLGNLRRRIVQMRRYIQPQRDALADLLVEDSETAEWHEWHRQRLREVADSTKRMMEDLAVVWERTHVLNEEMKGLADQLQGQRLYIMTIMTAIFLPLTFLTGLLGMNVGGVPFPSAPTENNYGFWVIVCICGGLVVVQLGIMKALGWLLPR